MLMQNVYIIFMFDIKYMTISFIITIISLLNISRLYGLAQNVSTLKYCSTLEMVFVHFREDFENLILELCFFTT